MAFRKNFLNAEVHSKAKIKLTGSFCLKRCCSQASLGVKKTNARLALRNGTTAKG